MNYYILWFYPQDMVDKIIINFHLLLVLYKNNFYFSSFAKYDLHIFSSRNFFV